MGKSFILALVFAFAGTVAQAQTAGDGRREITVSHPHNYWLSDGVNRLVFWQSPLQSGRSVALSRPADTKH